MAENIILTHKGIKELEEKLDYLKTVRRKEIAEEIKVARSFGDLSENAEYDEAKNEQAKIEGEIAQLEEMLKNAVVADDTDENTVSVGKFVTLKDEEYGDEKEYQIVGTAEANIFESKIPNESPVARAIMGKMAGETVDVETPGGMVKYTIVKIRK
jgi:transcription elongation factor GreA